MSETILQPQPAQQKFPAGGAQTLSQRKSAQQKKPSGHLDGVKQLPNGSWEYEQEALNDKLRMSLGYDLKNLFKDDQDEDELLRMPMFEREIIMAERHQRLEELKERLNLMLQKEMKNQQEIQHQKMQLIGQKRPRTTSEDQSESGSESDDEFSSEGSRSSSSSDSEDNYQDRRRDRKRQDKGDQRQRSPYQGSPHSEYSSDFEVYNKDNNQRIKSQKRPGPTVYPLQTIISVDEIVQSVDDLKPIILKRYQIEQFLDTNDFSRAVIGSLVRVQFKGIYQLAKVIDTKEEGSIYSLEKHRTNMQLFLKNGAATRWFKILLVSNGDATPQEYFQLMKASAKAEEKPMTLKQVKLKAMELKEIRQHVFNPEEIDAMVAKNFDKKIKEGKISGFNLTYQKIELKNDIGALENLIATSITQRKSSETVRELRRSLEDLRNKLRMVEEALQAQLARDNPLFTTREEGGESRTLTIEELEKKQAAENWVKQQQSYQQNPNQKKNNIFMQNLTREDTTHHQRIEDQALLQKQELQKLRIQRELDLIRSRSQQVYEETKHETYFEKMERQKRDYLAFIDSITFNFPTSDPEKLFKKDSQKTLQIPTPHPAWHEANLNKSDKEEAKQAKVIGFEEYFQK